MSVTLDVSKLSGWLNALASRNIWRMVVTLEVSKLSGWLNADAPRNIWHMLVTLEESQPDTSALKSFKSLKRLLMSVTAETSQVARGPYVATAAVGLALYAWAAVLRSAVLAKTLSTRRRRRVGGAGWWEASNTGSHCGGQVTPFSWRSTLTRSVRTKRSEEAS
eukprot:scaffold23484_cov46-Phaeocystis_antarctica.AAC.2